MYSSFSTASDAIGDIARHHDFSVDATHTMLKAVIAGRATMAQFSHSKFFGPGQWMHGSMTMVSDMFNHGLKGRVDALRRELSEFLARQPALDPGDGAPSRRLDDAVPWADLGRPDSTGSRNGMLYA